MAASVLADSSFLVALLSRRDRNRHWADKQALRLPPPWLTCEAAIAEAFFLLDERGGGEFSSLLRRGAVVCGHSFANDLDSVLRLKEKYANVPMSFADACLVRMTEVISDPVLLTTDSDFRIYRRHSRQVIPCVLPD